MLLGAGCASAPQTISTTSTSASVTSTSSTVINHDSHGQVTGLLPKELTAKLATVGDVHLSQEVYRPGAISMPFKIFGSNGKFYTPEDLEIVHEKPLHVLLVRRDLQVYQHVHPTYERGFWTVRTTIQEPGDYMAYLDFTSKKDGHQIWRLPFRVNGTWKESPPAPMSELKVVKDKIETELFFTRLLKVGEETRVRFVLKQEGKEYMNLQPYLGAFGHLVILEHGKPERYLHVHPLTETQPKDGAVEFMTTFPTPGKYTLFAEFNINGKVTLFPFTVEMTNEGVKNDDHGLMELH